MKLNELSVGKLLDFVFKNTIVLYNILIIYKKKNKMYNILKSIDVQKIQCFL